MRTVGIVIPFEFHPPHGGGPLRAFHMLRELACRYETHAVLLHPPNGEASQWLGPEAAANLHIYAPSKARSLATIWDQLPAGQSLRYRWLRRSWRGPANSVFLEAAPLLSEVLSARKVDAVIFEELDATSVAPYVRRLSPKTALVHDAYNVNTTLFSQRLEQAKQRGENTRKLARTSRDVHWREQHLDRLVDAFLACSREDRKQLAEWNRIPGFVIPNGVDTSAIAFRRGEDTIEDGLSRVLFVGGLSYLPNRDGLTWFSESIWPLVKAQAPEAVLTVVGRGGEVADFPALCGDPQVEFVGEVPDVVPYYHHSAVAVCPLRMGSGTRLKTLEAMSAGVPTVSTSLGIEGQGVVNGSHCLVADAEDDFAASVAMLMKNPQTALAISRRARRLVEVLYDWQAIGDQLQICVDKIIESAH